MAFKVGMTVNLCMAYNYAHAHVDDLDLDARSQSVNKGWVFYVTWTWKTLIWLDHLVLLSKIHT